jgi:hypothetical protein
MEGRESLGQETIDAGDVRDARHRSEPGADAAERVHEQDARHQARDAVQAEARLDRRDRLDDALQPAHLSEREGDEDRRGPQVIDDEDDRHRRGDGARHDAARVVDLVPHEGDRFEPGQGEGDGAPEDQPLEIEGGRQVGPVERGERAEAGVRRGAEADQEQAADPAGVRPEVVQPLRHRQPDEVHPGGERQRAQGKDDEVAAVRGQVPEAIPREEQAVAGREVEDAGEVRQVGHPVDPAAEEAARFAERLAAPDVQAPFVGVPRREPDGAPGERHRHGEEADEPDHHDAGAGGGRRGDPLKVDAGGDEEEEDVAEREALPEPRRRAGSCLRRSTARFHGAVV